MAKNSREIKIGNQAEESFKKLFTCIRRATKEEDILEHWDLEAIIEDKNVKVDVKAVKNENRYDPYPNENFHWVEIQNVNGDRGWLYGDSDLIVFETLDYFILVGRLKLKKFLEKKLGYSRKRISEIVPSSVKDPYVFYQRSGRKDIVVKVKTIDLMHIKYMSVKKI